MTLTQQVGLYQVMGCTDHVLKTFILTFLQLNIIFSFDILDPEIDEIEWLEKLDFFKNKICSFLSKLIEFAFYADMFCRLRFPMCQYDH